MNLKQTPEDFEVTEMPNRKFSEHGDYLVCKLTKKDWNTEDAIQLLARTIKTERKNISYSGTKDRRAITTQYITIYKGSKERLENIHIPNMQLEIIGRTNSPLSLGDLSGNEFKIVARNLEKNTRINKLAEFPNLFDSQRFSKNNAEIGKAIIQKNYAHACELLKTDGKYGTRITEALEINKNNYTTALTKIPKKILQIYIHAYQSKIWNETLETLGENAPEKLPLIGFGTELNEDETGKTIRKILEEEGITQRDFIIREFPELSPEGTERNTKAKIENLETTDLEEDELNPGKYKTTIKFSLGKGSYATMAIKHIITF